MRTKFVFSILLGALVVLAVVIYAIIASYDYNYLKPRLAQAVKDATGRELTLAGDINLDISLIPALCVDEVSLSNAPWGSRPQMISIKRLELEVKLLPLLSGELVVQRLILIQPDVLLETDAKGKGNWDFSKSPTESRNATKSAASQSGQRDHPQAAPESSSGDASLLAIWFERVALQSGTLVFRDGKTGRTSLLSIKALEADSAGPDSPVSLDLRGSYNRTKFNLDGSLGSIAQALNPHQAWPLDIKLEVAGATMEAKGVITDLTGASGIKLAMEVQGSELADLSDLAGAGLPELGRYALRGDLSDVAKKTYRVSGLRISVAGNVLEGWSQVGLGKSRPALKAELSSSRLDLRRLTSVEMREYTPPAGAPGNQGSKPQASSEAKAKSVDGSTRASGGDRVFSSRLLPLGALGLLDADLKIMLGELLVPRLAAKHLVMRLQLAGGKLTVKPLTADIGKGRLNMDLDLAVPKGKAALDLNLKLTGCELAAMLEQLGSEPGVEGQLGVVLQLKSAGPPSLAGIMAGLKGKAALTVGPGKVHNRYLDLLGGDLPAQLMRLINPAQAGDGYTTFDCIVAGMVPSQGPAPITALVFDTGQMTLVSGGKVNLASETLNLGVTSYPKKDLSKKENQVSLSLGELLKPLKLTGTFAHPQVGLDETRTAQTLGKAIAGFQKFGAAGLTSALAGNQGTVINACSQARGAALAGRVYTPQIKQPADQANAGQAGQSDGQQDQPDDLKNLSGALKSLFGN